MDQSHLNIIVLLIYIIAMSAAIFALWIKWVQDEQDARMKQIQKQYDELQILLTRIEARLEAMGHKDPFKRNK